MTCEKVGEERIETFFCDQTDSGSIKIFFDACSIHEFDIIIDDGLHTEDAAKTFFENSWSKLADGGTYCIEDAVWWSAEKKSFLDEENLRYFVFGNFRSEEIAGNDSASWNKIIMIVK